MQAGALRHYIDIQQVTGSTDDYGNQRQDWSALYSNVPADIQQITSRELYAGARPETLNSHRFMIRYLPGLTTAMRIKYGTRLFTITGIINKDERNITLELLGQEQHS